MIVNGLSRRYSTVTAVLAIIALLAVLVVLTRLSHHGETGVQARSAMRVGCTGVTNLFQSHESGTWVTVAAPVSEILPDAHGSATHQRFILKCPSETVLVENNIDVGKRASVKLGERVGVHGQYIWNALGGLVHDTHHATDPSTPDGWVYAGGNVYQ